MGSPPLSRLAFEAVRSFCLHVHLSRVRWTATLSFHRLFVAAFGPVSHLSCNRNDTIELLLGRRNTAREPSAGCHPVGVPSTRLVGPPRRGQGHADQPSVRLLGGSAKVTPSFGPGLRWPMSDRWRLTRHGHSPLSLGSPQTYFSGGPGKQEGVPWELSSVSSANVS